MRYPTIFIFGLALMISTLSLAPAPAFAQTSAQEKAAALRAQMAELETKQAEMQTRLQALDEKLKPENIERDLAGVGSTRPEDVREQRRRQLEIERNGVRAQLDLLTTSHSRLEIAIAKADADAYRQSAQPVTATPAIVPTATATPADLTTAAPPAPKPRRLKKKKAKKSRRVQQSPAN
jgi:chromosome segregation ATPase